MSVSRRDFPAGGKLPQQRPALTSSKHGRGDALDITRHRALP